MKLRMPADHNLLGVWLVSSVALASIPNDFCPGIALGMWIGMITGVYLCRDVGS